MARAVELQAFLHAGDARWIHRSIALVRDQVPGALLMVARSEMAESGMNARRLSPRQRMALIKLLVECYAHDVHELGHALPASGIQRRRIVMLRGEMDYHRRYWARMYREYAASFQEKRRSRLRASLHGTRRQEPS